MWSREREVSLRVALVAGPDAGHAFPMAALTRALIRRGHEATLVTSERWLGAAARDGIPGVVLPHLPALPHDPDEVNRIYVESARLAPVLAEALRPLRPDLVVGDVISPYANLAAGLLDVPWAQLVPHPLQDPTPYLPPSGSRLAPARTPIGRARDRWLYGVVEKQWEVGRQALAKCRVDLGLSPFDPPRARLIASLPALELPRPDWPADAHPVGPLEWDPSDTDLQLPPGDGPLVFLSASTVGGGAEDLLGTTLAAVELGRARLPRGIRVACTRFDPCPGELPEWAVAGPGRQGPLLDAAAVMVSGAGHGILAKAYERGTPVIAVPGAGEQNENADRLRRARLAVTIAPRKLTPERLAAALVKVLDDPSWTDRAERCRPAADAPAPGEVAVDVLESVMSSMKNGAP